MSRHHPPRGRNISAREVEEVVFGHTRFSDVAIIGVPDPEDW